MTDTPYAPQDMSDGKSSPNASTLHGWVKYRMKVLPVFLVLTVIITVLASLGKETIGLDSMNSMERFLTLFIIGEAMVVAACLWARFKYNVSINLDTNQVRLGMFKVVDIEEVNIAQVVTATSSASSSTEFRIGIEGKKTASLLTSQPFFITLNTEKRFHLLEAIRRFSIPENHNELDKSKRKNIKGYAYSTTILTVGKQQLRNIVYMSDVPVVKN